MARWLMNFIVYRDLQSKTQKIEEIDDTSVAQHRAHAMTQSWDGEVVLTYGRSIDALLRVYGEYSIGTAYIRDESGEFVSYMREPNK
jgi:hypothetical protein